MRLYSVTNTYCSGIHAGIQTAHAVANMWIKKKVRGGPKYSKGIRNLVLEEWARDHKTIIIFNGGMQPQLNEIHRLMLEVEDQTSFPCSQFKESMEAMNRTLTAVAIVLPEWVYRVKEEQGCMHFPAGWSQELRDLWTRLSKLSMAR